jgi:hypothetical protein
MSSKADPGVRYQAVDLSGGNVTLSPPCRALIIGTGGVVTGISVDATEASATGELPAGLFPVGFKRIDQASTAADITAIW